MAFESLTEKLQSAFKRLRGKGRLTENFYGHNGLSKIANKVTWYIFTYDSLLIESGGRCNIDAYIDEYLTIARECINVTGTTDFIIAIIENEIKKYDTNANKDWLYLDKMLSHLQLIKNSILAL